MINSADDLRRQLGLPTQGPATPGAPPGPAPGPTPAADPADTLRQQLGLPTRTAPAAPPAGPTAARKVSRPVVDTTVLGTPAMRQRVMAAARKRGESWNQFEADLRQQAAATGKSPDELLSGYEQPGGQQLAAVLGQGVTGAGRIVTGAGRAIEAAPGAA